MEKVILFGLSHEAKRLFQIYGNENNQFDLNKWVIAIADNNKDLWDTAFNEKMIINPQKIMVYDYDKIVVCLSGTHAENVRKQLVCQYKIEESKVSYLHEYLTLPQEKIDGCKLLVDRKSALSCLEKNLVVAEVGVAFGGFTRKLLDIMKPRKFYAIDYFFADNPYLINCGGMWNNPKFRGGGLTLLEFYKKRFQKEEENGILEVKEGYSWEVLEKFEDDTFDYIYLDAAHDFESVSKDINVIKKKIKTGGIVQFNDYGFIHADSKECCGVLPAVNKFLWEAKCEVLYYCINGNGLDDLVVRIDK